MQDFEHFCKPFSESVLIESGACCGFMTSHFLFFEKISPTWSKFSSFSIMYRNLILYNSVQFCTKFKNHDLSSQMSLLPIGWYGYIISATCESPRLRNRLRGAHHFCGDFGSPQLPKIELTAVSV